VSLVETAAGRGTRHAAQSVPKLTPARKILYSLGDFSGNTSLAALSLIYASFFLISVGGLRPALAGLVPLVGRVVDAVADPVMGRASDLTRWRGGRRRPYFLIGAVPLGVTFALMWMVPPYESQAARFAYYAIVYIAHALAMTLVSVPHLALQPEMVLGYDERTSLVTYRNAAALVGIMAAVSVRWVAAALGGEGAPSWTLAGVVYGVLIAVPWFAVWWASFEREEFRTRASRLGFADGMRVIARHRNFRYLTGLYLAGRTSMDLVGTMLILYFTYYIGRSDDFELLLMVFLPAAALSLPVWLRVSEHSEKARIFRVGAYWWMVGQLLLLVATPEWPRWALFVFAPLSGLGYAVVDLMPWSMLADVIDEDDVTTGERREGVYHGVFLFLRKLGGAAGVFLALGILDLAGFAPDAAQSPAALTAIRLMASVGPAACLLAAVWLSRGYALTRSEHAKVRGVLDTRERGRAELSAIAAAS
jgi:sugar (glycoside-pentoside-hexuronide) transporter